MNTSNFLLLCALIYLISLVDFSFTQCTPVYSRGNVLNNKAVPSLQVVNQEWLMDHLENRLNNKGPIVVFAEQSLSPEDFLLRNEKDRSIFRSLAGSQKSVGNYWPCIRNPMGTFDKVKDRTVIKTTSEQFLKEPAVLQSKDILIVDLDDAKEDEDRVNMLKRHDTNIGKIYGYLQQQHDDLTMFFTGRQPSWITVDEVRSHRRIRDTTNANAENEEIKYVVYSNEDVLISALDSPAVYNNNTMVSLKDAKISSNQTENGFILDMAVDSLTVKWEIEVGGGYWTLKKITVSQPNYEDFYFRTKEIYAPRRFSYHCVTPSFVNAFNPMQNMSFDHLQMQVFFDGDKQEGKFGDAFDCTGFMSAAIWSGLFVTFILVLIMTCGLTMMMDIKTMDRFDDPKGKTITINASE